MNGDQRKRHRLGLRLPVLLTRANGDQSISSETLNISTDGFYCTTPEAFAPGERLHCRITLPNERVTSPGLYLDAEVEVVRVAVSMLDSGFGYGCRILEYRLLGDEEAASRA
ncbi:MAG TPA: PilZ domain-containing protein [Bryobacteraceae bacterium]|nr:PilZ domain-containing protein [Bryobacteraceae bacterium]